MSAKPSSVDFSWLKNFAVLPVQSGELNHDNYEVTILVTSENDLSPSSSRGNILDEYFNVLRQYKAADKEFESGVHFLLMQTKNGPRKIIHSPIGRLNRDYDDVRRFAEASEAAVQRAVKTGAKKFVVLFPSNTNEILGINADYVHYRLVSLLGALGASYLPLELREISAATQSPSHKFEAKFDMVLSSESGIDEKFLKVAHAIESGRVACRDIGGSDPERMAPPNVARYVQALFANTCIKVEIIEDEELIQKQFPLLAAVNRGARGIERHRARVIFLTYEPTGPYETTVALVGKGVTYDTGGADVKAGGHMAGMHRDKCGAAAVAGFFQTLAILQPKGIKVLGGMCMVRNSIGSDCYVSDEIITSRAGKRIRIGNTDAEGRMAMGDILCYMKERVMDEKDPHIFTVATLTGHACLAAGQGYSIVLANGPAKKAGVDRSLQNAGNLIGDMFEISTIRREDYKFHEGPSIYEDLLQCNNLPSSQTERGHQTPAAFLIMASGLEKHGIDSEKPLKYCHLDIAASSGPFPGVPSGAPIPALVKRFVLPETVS